MKSCQIKFLVMKKKSEKTFGGGSTKQRRNDHTSYLRAEARYPNKIVEIDGCNNAPLEFREFVAEDGNASQIKLQSIGGHVFQITAVASLGAIETIYYAPNAWCTSIAEKRKVNRIGLTIISDSRENGGIRIIRILV